MSSRWGERLLASAKGSSISRWFLGGSVESKGQDTPLTVTGVAEDSAANMLQDLASPTGAQFHLDPGLTVTWCELYALILPGFFVTCTQAARRSVPSAHPAWKAINFLCFSTHCVRKLWAFLRNERLHNIEAHCQGFDPNVHFRGDGLIAAVSVFCTLLSQMLIALDDMEMYDRERPFPLFNFVAIVRCFKHVLYDILRHSTLLAEGHSPMPTHQMDTGDELSPIVGSAKLSFALVLASVMRSLYDRCSRRPFCSSAMWTVAEADSNRILGELRAQTAFGETLLRKMPYAIEFTERLKLFRHFVAVNVLA